MKSISELLLFPVLILTIAVMIFLFLGEPDVMDAYRAHFIEKYMPEGEGL